MGIAGVFNFIAAASGLGLTALVFTQPPPGTAKYNSDFWSLVIVLLVFAAVTLAGGIQALRRKTWRLTFASSILAIILTPSLGIPATIFTSAYKPIKQPKEQGTITGTGMGKKKPRWWLIPIFMFCIPLAVIPLGFMWL